MNKCVWTCASVSLGPRAGVGSLGPVLTAFDHLGNRRTVFHGGGPIVRAQQWCRGLHLSPTSPTPALAFPTLVVLPGPLGLCLPDDSRPWASFRVLLSPLGTALAGVSFLELCPWKGLGVYGSGQQMARGVPRAFPQLPLGLALGPASSIV